MARCALAVSPAAIANPSGSRRARASRSAARRPRRSSRRRPATAAPVSLRVDADPQPDLADQIFGVVAARRGIGRRQRRRRRRPVAGVDRDDGRLERRPLGAAEIILALGAARRRLAPAAAAGCAGGLDLGLRARRPPPYCASAGAAPRRASARSRGRPWWWSSKHLLSHESNRNRVRPGGAPARSARSRRGRRAARSPAASAASASGRRPAIASAAPSRRLTQIRDPRRPSAGRGRRASPRRHIGR